MMQGRPQEGAGLLFESLGQPLVREGTSLPLGPTVSPQHRFTPNMVFRGHLLKTE